VWRIDCCGRHGGTLFSHDGRKIPCQPIHGLAANPAEARDAIDTSTARSAVARRRSSARLAGRSSSGTRRRCPRRRRQIIQHLQLEDLLAPHEVAVPAVRFA
jgi:hypothetical protein